MSDIKKTSLKHFLRFTYKDISTRLKIPYLEFQNTQFLHRAYYTFLCESADTWIFKDCLYFS